MLAEERLSRIMKLLSQQRTATVQELCEALDASESTIRRDLNELDRMGKVNKVHGGATLPDSQFLADEPTMAAKEALAVVQKKCIAKAAAALITAEDFVFLDAGSTTLALAPRLRQLAFALQNWQWPPALNSPLPSYASFAAGASTVLAQARSSSRLMVYVLTFSRRGW